MLNLARVKYDINLYTIDKLLYLLSDRPDKTNKDYYSMYWYNDKGEYHKNYDLPAVLWPDGDVVWFKNNTVHRDNNQPARYWFGKIEYWVNGNKIINGWGKV